MRRILDEDWMENVKAKNDSGDVITIRRHKKLLKLI